jgi:hypothetical protein
MHLFRPPLLAGFPGSESAQHILWATLLSRLLVWTGCAHRTASEFVSQSCLGDVTVADCQAEADSIENDCLKECVKMQCAGIKVDCGETTQQRCKRKESLYAYTDNYPGVTNCRFAPTNKTHCCERLLKKSKACRVKVLVHELAHSCGWDEEKGPGIPNPANDEESCE